MGDKYEFMSVIYSRYGFRDHRECRYRVKVTYPNGKTHYYFYENIPDLRKLCVV